MIEIRLTGVSPSPQGSGRAMLIGGKARYIATASNASGKRLRAYRKELAAEAMRAVSDAALPLPVFGKHVPVCLSVTFFLLRPPSTPKKRHWPVVSPDIDKLMRSTNDALAGIVFVNDAQVVEVGMLKVYGDFEGVSVTAQELKI
jgi:Holliday junction resolvase RusA-like endonuclease